MAEFLRPGRTVASSVTSVSGHLAAWLVLAFAAGVPLFWYGLEGLALTWSRQPARALVPVVCVAMFVHVLRGLPERDGGVTRWPGAVAVGGAVLLAAVSRFAELDDVVVLALIGWLSGLLVCVFGLSTAWRFWAPVLASILMLPLPRFVSAPFISRIEEVAAGIGSGVAGIFGGQVSQVGRYVDFGGYEMKLADAVAVPQNMAAVVLAALAFAVFSSRSWRWRLAPLALAVPVAVLVGASRVALLSALRDGLGTSAFESAVSATGGKFATVAAIVILVGPFLFRARGAATRAGDHGRSGAGGPPAHRAGAALIAAALVTLGVSAATALVPERKAAEVARDPFSYFPPEIGQWSGARSIIADSTASVLDADDYVNIDYAARGERAPVNFWSAYYHEQSREAGASHSPEVCLPGAGWNIVSFDQIEVAVGEATDDPITLNRATISKDGSTQLVYYWFDGRGRRIADEFRNRMLTKVDRLLEGRSDGALVRFVTPVRTDETEADADARIRRLLVQVAPRLDRFIPG